MRQESLIAGQVVGDVDGVGFLGEEVRDVLLEALNHTLEGEKNET